MNKRNEEYVKLLKIGEVFNKYEKYIIPIYQRNYAWESEEINLLIQDIKNAYLRAEEKSYYIGSLVVYKIDDTDFEVIDGQQRLTTLTLIIHYLKSIKIIANGEYVRNVYFEHREESEKALSNLDSNNLPTNFRQALNSIKYSIQNEWDVRDIEKITKFLLEKVEIIRTEVPEDTDLNHYFEIMNTRGEQLEKHEVLKARLMDILPKGSCERSIFAQMWNACSDMSRYIVMGLDSKIRSKIFGDNWQTIPKGFNEIINAVENIKDECNSESSRTILSIIDIKTNLNQEVLSKKYDGEFTSVIDFPNFLMHVIRIYLEEALEEFKDIPLDEKALLESFKGKFENRPDKVREFAYTLLICRYLFDCYVIKSSTIRTGEENWSLWKIVPSKSSYYYKNIFDDDGKEEDDDGKLNNSVQTKEIVMLLSMFHVSNPSRIYKNWLYAVLRMLYKNREEIKSEEYIEFLETLCDKFYFGNNCQGKELLDIILNEENNFFIANKHEWNDGVAVPNFVFNRLDYQLWKLHKEEYPKFRFTFRSSVEHHYPQNPSQEHNIEKLDQETLNNFGNLYLLSQSKNSRLSNLTPEAKCSFYDKSKKNYDSLKQALMMSCNNNWGREEILKHNVDMLEILNTPILKLIK